MTHTLQSLLTLAETDQGKQQIRVMVAEACGFALVPWQGVDFYYFQPTEEAIILARDGQMTGALREYALPDYHISLDVMGYVEATLSEHERYQYESWLRRLLLLTPSPFWVISAKAIYRAIAFILTKA